MAAMAETLAGALLLEEAAADLAAGDGRKAVVAKLFAETRLSRRRVPVIDVDSRWADPYFEALIGYERVGVEKGLLRAAS